MRSMERKTKDAGVSPVVGVMLMLVVVIIIAAVVSGFAGSLVSDQKKAPTLTADAEITNTGYYYGSYFSIVVTGASEPVPSKDVKIVTSWKARDGTKNSTSVLPSAQNWHYGTSNGVAPWATGPGITAFGLYNTKDLSQNFGNYSFTSGTSLRAYPNGAWAPPPAPTSDPLVAGGYGPGPAATYTYVNGAPGVGYTIGTDIDAMQAVLGLDWNHLREGDVVNVKMVHTPSGKVIFEKEVPVRGG